MCMAVQKDINNIHHRNDEKQRDSIIEWATKNTIDWKRADDSASARPLKRKRGG